MTPTRLWTSAHAHGWETWIVERDDGTYAAWACAAGENASNFYVEDTFEHAKAAALFRLAHLSAHESCTGECGPWIEREPPRQPGTSLLVPWPSAQN